MSAVRLARAPARAFFMDKPNPFRDIKTADSYLELGIFTLVVIVAQVVSLLLTGLAADRFGFKPDTYEAMIPAFLFTAGLCWKVLADFGVSFRAAWEDWQAKAGQDLLKALKYLAGYAAVLLVMFAALLAVYALIGESFLGAMDKVASTSEGQTASAKALSVSVFRYGLLLLSTCAIAPVVEELFFRRLVFTALRRRNGFWPSAFWSALLFALFHGAGAPVTLPVGIYLAWVYERERRLPVNIMLHAMVNFLMMTYKVFS